MTNTHYIGDVPTFDLVGSSPTLINDAKLRKLIKRLNRLPVRGWPVGLEDAIFNIPAGKIDLEPHPLIDVRGKSIKHVDNGASGHFPARMPCEVAAKVLWNSLDTGILKFTDLERVGAFVSGKPSFRVSSAVSTKYSSGDSFAYVHASDVKPRIERMLNTINNTPSKNFEIAATALFDIWCIHPLEDGNGRLGRTMLQGLLYKWYGLRFPLLPIGPVLGANRSLMVNAILAWHFDRNPTPFIETVFEALLRTGELTLIVASAHYD